MVKRTLIVIALLTSMNIAFAQSKDALVGKWVTSSGDAHILIYPSGTKYSGRIVWLKKPNDSNGKPEIDDKNPDAALAKRPIIGLELLKGFSYANAGLWEGGTIYDPKTGKTYSCKITMSNQNQLNVRGFVGISLLGRSETWSRVR